MVGTYPRSTVDEKLANGQWPFNHPFYLVLNLSVGGFFPQMPAAEKYPEVITEDDPSFQKVTALPADGTPVKMYVDYIRVYKR